MIYSANIRASWASFHAFPCQVQIRQIKSRRIPYIALSGKIKSTQHTPNLCSQEFTAILSEIFSLNLSYSEKL